MKFSLAWADIAQQNVGLKVALAAVSVMGIVLAAALSAVTVKAPLIIDRGCSSQSVHPGPIDHTKEEVTSFVRAALTQRFNSDAAENALLSESQVRFKREDLQKLKSANISQTILVRSLSVTEHGVEVDSDRVLAVGDVRSALLFPLEVVLAQVPRSEENPYGLVLDKVLPMKREDKK